MIVRFASIAVAVGLLAIATPAAAQKFEFGKAEEVEKVEVVDWTAVAEAGLVVTTGNSETTTATGTAKASRLDKWNKLALELGFAYARSSVLFVSDDNLDGAISEDEIDETESTTAKSWNAKIRYDRFLTAHNSLYVAALAAADEPAGKELVAGGQVGYSRQVFKNTQHEVVAEIGYDFSYENLVVGPGISIHSVRAFAGYKGTINDKTAIDASFESLSNLNTLATVPDEAGPFEDTRLTAIAGLSTKLTAAVSFSFSVTAKYDNVPSPRAPFALPYEAGFVPVADKLDTITKASIIVALF